MLLDHIRLSELLKTNNRRNNIKFGYIYLKYLFASTFATNEFLTYICLIKGVFFYNLFLITYLSSSHEDCRVSLGLHYLFSITIKYSRVYLLNLTIIR